MKKVTEYNQFVRSAGIIQQDLIATSLSIYNCWQTMCSRTNNFKEVTQDSAGILSAGQELYSENNRMLKEITLFSHDPRNIYESKKICGADLDEFINVIVKTFHNNTHILAGLSNSLANYLPKHDKLLATDAGGRAIYFQAEDFGAGGDEELSIQEKFLRVVIGFEKFFLGLSKLNDNLYSAVFNFKNDNGEMCAFLKSFRVAKNSGCYSGDVDGIREIHLDWNNFEFLKIMKMCGNILDETELSRPVTADYDLYALKGRQEASRIILALVKICGEGRRRAGTLERLIDPTVKNHW